MPKILVTDPLHAEGQAVLQAEAEAEVDVRLGPEPNELLDLIGAYDALIVRSETQVTREVLEAGRRLQVVGRAGVGVDNIDVEAATRQGVAVVNAPTGNTIAAAEHAIAMLMSLARNVPQANRSLLSGEWKRSAYVGVEVRDKTLGVVGLGRIGTEVARRAQGLQMHVLGYDPFVSPDHVQRMGMELASLDRIVREADFITVHTPLTDATRGLIGKRELEMAKPSVRLINCARGGLIDEQALLEALNEDRVAGVALDVFVEEPPGAHPLLRHPKVVATPHLGASTTEAQAEVARQAAQQVLMVLRGEPAPYTVNAAFVLPETQKVVGPFSGIATIISKVAMQLMEGQLAAITIRYHGEIADYDTGLLKSSVLAGILGPISDERVNVVNAPLLASQWGLRVVEEKEADGEHYYSSLITVTIHTTQGNTSTVGGTVMRGEPHLVRVDDYWLDIVPNVPYLLLTQHQDRPGIIGAVGSITGQHDINISFMEVGRQAPRGQAMMVLGLDDPIPESVMQEVLAQPYVGRARLVTL